MITNMETIYQNSLDALDKVLNEIPEEEIENIINSIPECNGITFDEYLKLFSL